MVEGVNMLNSATLKTSGVVINETANIIGASCDMAQESVHKKLTDNEITTHGFGWHLKGRHNDDFKIQKVIDGRIDIKEYISANLSDVPEGMKDALDKIMKRQTVQPNTAD